MSNVAILVTGGAGYVGSHACKALARAGYLPVTYDSLERGHREAVRWGPLEIGDLGDAARLNAVLTQWKPAAVMHFAGYISVGESVTDPALYYRHNVAGTASLLDAMRAHDLRAIVFSSTAAVYGDPDQVPIPEDHPKNPVSPYGTTKLIVERMLQDFDAAYGLRSAALRYFNAAGADPDGEIGEAHEPETHLIPLVLDAAAGRRPDIRLYGNDYETPDGTCVRDYIHVSDLSVAHVAALRRLLDGGQSFAVNLGTGTGWSVRQVVEAAGRVTGRAIPVSVAPRRAGDAPVLVADPSAARRLLDWVPARSGLDEQIADAWAWHQKSRSPLAAGTAAS